MLLNRVRCRLGGLLSTRGRFSAPPAFRSGELTGDLKPRDTQYSNILEGYQSIRKDGGVSFEYQAIDQYPSVVIPKKKKKKMSIPRVSEPLGCSAPYVIPAYEGEGLQIPGSKSTIRILASARESDDLISVFHMDGVVADAPGFHYHNEAHDIFMCTKGQMKVWAGDQCRILGPGDFCSVPPVS